MRSPSACTQRNLSRQGRERFNLGLFFPPVQGAAHRRAHEAAVAAGAGAGRLGRSPSGQRRLRCACRGPRSTQAYINGTLGYARLRRHASWAFNHMLSLGIYYIYTHTSRFLLLRSSVGLSSVVGVCFEGSSPRPSSFAATVD